MLRYDRASARTAKKSERSEYATARSDRTVSAESANGEMRVEVLRAEVDARTGGKAAADARAGSGFSCSAAGECGGCSLINVPYQKQLADKNARMQQLFTSVIEQSGAELHPIMGMDDPRFYRNKVTSPFAPGKRGPHGGRDILCGMYAPGTHRIIPTEDCLLENQQAQQVIQAIRQLMKRYKMQPYHEDSGKGFVRHAVVRVGHESGEVLVTLVTNGEDFPSSRAFCRELVKKCPFITTIVQNINTARSNVILGQEERRLYGPGFILDTLCGLSFRISSQSFYQVNAVQTTRLYETAIQLAGLTGNEIVFDAYCGTGTIGLVAARRGASMVLGVDSVESSIRDARMNAQHNDVQNARFVVADAADFMREQADSNAHVDVVFLDPPRAGCSFESLDALIELAPLRIVYVSCNPDTQVRDLDYLMRGGYRVCDIQPVDMFPHTAHIESIVLLEQAGR